MKWHKEVFICIHGIFDFFKKNGYAIENKVIEKTKSMFLYRLSQIKALGFK